MCKFLKYWGKCYTKQLYLENILYKLMSYKQKYDKTHVELKSELQVWISPSFVKFDTWLLNTSETQPETVHRKKAWFVSVGAFVRLFVVRFGFQKFVLFTTFDTLVALICVVSTYLYVVSSTDLWEISKQNKLIWADLFAPFKVLGT